MLLLLREFKWINFYFPWNHQKIYVFLMIPGGIEVDKFDLLIYYLLIKWCWAIFLVFVVSFQGIVILFEKRSWKYDFPLGLFAYLSGNMLIIEDLCNGRQKFLSNQNEELSTMALQNDGQVIAVASCQNSRKKFESLISIWNLSTCSCDKVSNWKKFAWTGFF